MVHVFRCVLATCSACVGTSFGNIVPASFALVSEEDMGTIVPSEPASHTVSKHEDFTFRFLVNPVSHGAFKIRSVSRDFLGELALETGEHIVERQSVSRQVNPAGVSSEDSQGLSGPHAVGFAPVGDIGQMLVHVCGKTSHIVDPLGLAALDVNVLFKDLSPLFASNALIELFKSLCNLHSGNIELGRILNIGIKFLVSLVILVIEWATFKLNNTCESVHMVDSSGSSDFSTEAMTSNSCSSNLVFVHKPDNIIGKVFHCIGIVMVRHALVAVVETPYIAQITNAVVRTVKERSEILCWLNNFGQPNHSRHIAVLGSDVRATQLYAFGVCLLGDFARESADGSSLSAHEPLSEKLS